jgi:hypothetical protein
MKSETSENKMIAKLSLSVLVIDVPLHQYHKCHAQNMNLGMLRE